MVFIGKAGQVSFLCWLTYQAVLVLIRTGGF